MMYVIAGGGVMSANYPPESELSRKFKQIIGAARRYLEGFLCSKSTIKH